MTKRGGHPPAKQQGKTWSSPAICEAELLDWEAKSVAIIEIPAAGGGAEVGLYWYVGLCDVLGE